MTKILISFHLIIIFRKTTSKQGAWVKSLNIELAAHLKSHRNSEK